MVSSAFGLGVDFGTSSTVAMLRWPDGRVKPLLFEGSPLLPSAVFAPAQGPLVVGSDALHHGRFEPSQLEPNPKRLIDDEGLLLGEREVSVAELLTAVLRHVATEAARVTGGVLPATALAYPAGWGTVRRGALLDAAQAAGLGAVTLVPEPVAAADYFTRVLHRDVPVGQALVVYDLGAGTFDSSAVRRVESGFEVAAVDGLTDLGGLDLDAAIVAWLRQGPAAGHEEQWARLDNPTTPEDRRQRRMLWDDVRIAKEMLSRAPAVILRLPALDLEVQFTRDEFEAAVQPLLARTVRTTGALMRYAGLGPETIAGLLLVGGASRVPLAATLLHRTLEIAPVATEQPELIVAEGALQSVVPATRPVVAGHPVSAAPVSGHPVSGHPVSGAPYPTSGAPVSGQPAATMTPPHGYAAAAPGQTPPHGYAAAAPWQTPPHGYATPAAPVSPSVAAAPAPSGVGFAHPQTPAGHWAAVPTAPHQTVDTAGQSHTGTIYTGGSVPPPAEPPRPAADADRAGRVIPVWDVAAQPGPHEIRAAAAPAPPVPAPGPPRRSRVRLLVAGVVAVWIVIAAVVVAMNLPGADHTNVPDVAGVSQQDATTQLAAAKLEIGNVTYEDSTAVPAEMVIRTEPAANQRVDEGTRVTVVLARTPAGAVTVTLPDLANKTRDEATNALTAVGLSQGEVSYEQSSSVGEGLVIRTDPAANTQVPQGATVKLVLASKSAQQQQGGQPCHVPDVAHKPRDHAVSDLEHAKVPYQVKKEGSDSVDAGTVIRTDPPAGRLDTCRRVTVYVSQGPPITVPHVVGSAEGYAKQQISDKGLTPVVKHDNYCGPAENKEAVVTKQSPGGNSTAYQGDTVTITIPKYTGTCPSSKTS